MSATHVRPFFSLLYLAVLVLFASRSSITTCVFVYMDVNHWLDSEYIKEMWFKIKNFKQPSTTFRSTSFCRDLETPVVFCRIQDVKFIFILIQLKDNLLRLY